MDSTVFWAAPDVRDRWERLMAIFEPRPGEHILDVGFGSGIPARYVAARVGLGGRVGAIDTSPRAVEQLRARVTELGVKNLDITRATAEALPFADATFDAILCVNVLEAVPDKPRALREMRRVLKPGGRVLVAHDDYEAQVYASTDRELNRRVTLAYASSTFAMYATSDGQMGRHLWGLFRAAGFSDPRLDVLPLVNWEYREPLLGWSHAQFPADFVAKVSDLTEAVTDAWRADLEARGARGEYLYCVNLYTCSSRK